MNKSIYLVGVAVGLIAVFSCDTTTTTTNVDRYDLLARARQSKVEILCTTNEPFASLGFNYDGEGKIQNLLRDHSATT